MLSREIDSLKPAPTVVCRQHFEAFAEYAPCIMWTADADGAITFLNKRFREFTGYSGVEHLTCFHPDDVLRCRSNWQESVRLKRTHKSHARVLSAKGEYRWMVSRATPMRGPDGEVQFWLGSASVLARHIAAGMGAREAA